MPPESRDAERLVTGILLRWQTGTRLPTRSTSLVLSYDMATGQETRFKLNLP